VLLSPLGYGEVGDRDQYDILCGDYFRRLLSNCAVLQTVSCGPSTILKKFPQKYCQSLYTDVSVCLCRIFGMFAYNLCCALKMPITNNKAKIYMAQHPYKADFGCL